MQVGRAPNILGDPIARGWCSSRPVRTFEDAVIFVLDVEKCLDQLGSLDRMMLSRIVLQEYTQAETAHHAGDVRPHHLLQVSRGPGPADGKAAEVRTAGSAALIHREIRALHLPAFLPADAAPDHRPGSLHSGPGHREIHAIQTAGAVQQNQG